MQASDAVTLICFGAPLALVNRFERLAKDFSCDDVMQDPYILFDLVLEELVALIDQVAWLLGDVFGEIETETLDNTSTPGQAARAIDFVGLHNVAKHVIYLHESSEAALFTAESLRVKHKQLIGENPTPCNISTQDALEYRKSLLQSTQRRIVSMDRRMGNIINLSFNLVTQQDSRIMQRDSKSMRTIAVVTMVFLPVATVAGVFGSQLITLDSTAQYHLRVSPDFWILWAIAAPLTVVVMVVWRLWYMHTRAKLMKGKHPDGDGATKFMQWRPWGQRIRNSEKVEHIA